MFKRLSLILVITIGFGMVSCSSDKAAVEGEEFGQGITLAESMTLNEVFTQVSDLNGKVVRVSGTVSDLCKHKGCWMQVSDGKKIIGFDDLLKRGIGVEDNFFAKYSVYRDLRSRGLLVRTGFKFGTDFRVYDRGGTVKSAHSKYLVHVVPEEYTCSFPELARSIRLSKNVNKDMIYGIVDEEGDISYYLVDRVKL